MEEPGFWDNPEKSTRMVREAKNLKDEVETFRELEQEYEDIQVMIQMGYEAVSYTHLDVYKRQGVFLVV